MPLFSSRKAAARYSAALGDPTVLETIWKRGRPAGV